MAFTNPSVADFSAYFNRDFPYGTDPNTSVLDSDITKAFVSTNVNFPTNLFSDQANYTLAYLLMSAHFLVLNLRASSQGINGQYAWLESSKGAGPVNVSFAIPPMVTDNPYWSMLTKTNYGAQFLQIVLPQLIGQMWGSYAPTHP